MRIKRLMTAALVLVCLTVLLPAPPASAALPPVHCGGEPFNGKYCVWFDGVNVAASMEMYGDQGLYGRTAVELAYYDWTQNHLRVHGLRSIGRTAAASGGMTEHAAPRTIDAQAGAHTLLENGSGRCAAP